MDLIVIDDGANFAPTIVRLSIRRGWSVVNRRSNGADEDYQDRYVSVNVHFAASTQNFIVLEYHPDHEGPRREIVDEPMRLVDGYLELPERPGLGLDLVEEALGRYPFRSWHRPFPLRPDGSLAFQ